MSDLLYSVTPATRKYLFHILFFLDGVNSYYNPAMHSLVLAALFNSESSIYRIYFAARHDSNLLRSGVESTCEYAVIVGVKFEHLIDSEGKTKRSRYITAWIAEDLPSDAVLHAYRSVGAIDWNTDAIVELSTSASRHQNVPQYFLAQQGKDEELNLSGNAKQGGSINLEARATCWPCGQYVMTIQDALKLQLTPADNSKDVYVKSLERHHAQAVYDHWPYKDSTVVDYVAEEISNLPSAGVFLKAGEQLVSWIMYHPPEGMSRLHTLEEYRGRGYASLAVKYLAKRVAQSGFMPFTNIVKGNLASSSLFEKIGFRRTQDYYVYEVIPR